MQGTRDTLKKTYNTISSHFDSTRKKPWPAAARFIKTQPKDTTLLDLASGTGRHSLYAKNLGLNPIAGDFSIAQLRELKKKDKTIPAVMLDLTALPFKDHAFDSVICIAALHHLETEKKRLTALNESHRTLKPRKPMLTSVWALDQPRFMNKTKDGDIHHTWNKLYPRFYHLFRDGELKQLAEKAGIHITSSYREKDNIYLISRAKNRTIGTKTR